MPRPFPTQPNLEHFRKQAKLLLRDVRAGDDAASLRARRTHPRWSAGIELLRGFFLDDGAITPGLV